MIHRYKAIVLLLIAADLLSVRPLFLANYFQMNIWCARKCGLGGLAPTNLQARPLVLIILFAPGIHMGIFRFQRFIFDQKLRPLQVIMINSAWPHGHALSVGITTILLRLAFCISSVSNLGLGCELIYLFFLMHLAEVSAAQDAEYYLHAVDPLRRLVMCLNFCKRKRHTYLEAPPFDQAANNQRDDLAAQGDTQDEAEHDEEGAEVLMIEGVASSQVP